MEIWSMINEKRKNGWQDGVGKAGPLFGQKE